jgi:hypothetical protein
MLSAVESKSLVSFLLSTCGLTTWLGDTVRRVGLATAICNTEGSVINSSVISGTAVRITDIVRIRITEDGEKDNIPGTTTCVVEVGTDVMREAVLRVSVAQRSAGAASSASSVAGIARMVSECKIIIDSSTDRAYSPLPDGLAP